MVTIYDVSKKSGYSPTTVSKALNNYSDIKKETKEKIKKIARQMGYFPNSQAQALTKKKTWNIGVLFIDAENTGLSHYFFSQILEHFKREAELKGYDLTFISKDIGNRDITYLEHCRHRQVDGLIIACIDFSILQIQDLLDSHIPVVVIDQSLNNNSCIISDNENGAKMLYNYLYNLGHRRIAYLHGQRYKYVTESRLTGFFQGLEEYNQILNPEYLIEGRYYSPKIGYDNMKKLLSVNPRPTAVMLSDDYMALGAIDAIKDSGLTIPDDISVVGYDGIELSQVIRPRLTTIKQQTDLIGQQAARVLIEMIEVPNKKPEIIKIPVVLIEGETTKNI